METEKLKHPGITTADETVNQLLEQFQDLFIFESNSYRLQQTNERMYHTHITYKIIFN